MTRGGAKWREVERKTDRTVIGIEDRSSLSLSICATCFRNETKWLLSISAASSDSRGAHRLHAILSVSLLRAGQRDSRLGVADVSLHPLDVNLPLDFGCNLLVHVDIHDVFGDRLKSCQQRAVHEWTNGLTLSLASLCSSFISQMRSNRLRMVVCRRMNFSRSIKSKAHLEVDVLSW